MFHRREPIRLKSPSVAASSFRTLFATVCMIVVATATALSAEPAKEAPHRGNRLDSDRTNDPRPAGRWAEHAIQLDAIPTLVVSTNGSIHEYIEPEHPAAGSTAGACGEVTYTDPQNFEDANPVELNIQQGFAEGEIAIASFAVDPAAFPVKIEAMECVFAQDTSVETVTEWSVLIWDGPPQLGVGMLVAEFSSDDIMLPHLRMNRGLQGTNLKIVVDPDDPEPLFLFNDSGTDMFSIGFRIDRHNNAPVNPCSASPDPDSNAFPTTDADGVFTLTNNWLSALFCGYLCDGVNPFADLLEFVCRPSGDWVIRVTYSCSLTGACCDVNGTCIDSVGDAACAERGGTFMGGGSVCSEVTCLEPTGACCFGGQCLPDTTQPLCQGLSQGVYMGNGTECTSTTCELGACCMPDGTCDDLIDISCEAAGGTFEGGGTDCATFDCPQPIGSCCIEGTCFPNQPRDVCEAVGTWNGIGSTCDPDPCASPTCPEATILGATPPSGTIDARQPSEPGNALPRQGIGSPSEPIVITLGVEGAEASCFVLCETAEDPVLGANSIASVLDTGGGQYEVVLDHAITPGAATTIQYTGDGSFVEYVSHPGNANGDSACSPIDILFVIDVLNGIATPPHGLFSVDVDHSGLAAPADILRVIDLLNGADAYDVWNGTVLPINDVCP